MYNICKHLIVLVSQSVNELEKYQLLNKGLAELTVPQICDP